jgi:hypothetical protein
MESTMATVTVATLQTAWDCRWSRPGFRVTGIPDRQQPETVWVCVRQGTRTDIAAEQCATCAFWQADAPITH